MAKEKAPNKDKQAVRKDVKDLSEQLQVLHGLSDPTNPGKPEELNARIKVIEKLLDKDTFLCANIQLHKLTGEDLGPAGKPPGETDQS
jgi:hypothetical protein